MRTPVVLITFNRPELTQKVFQEIRSAQPPHLFLISDGPREKRPHDIAKIMETRKLITKVDWKCEVHTKFENENLGCRRSVSEGLDWVFDQVDRAIILEDDCIPHPSFFRYCEELLEKYKDEKRISMISGDNFFSSQQFEASYSFSYHSLIWGWATWKRAWNEYRKAEQRGLSYYTQNFQALNTCMTKSRLEAIKKTLEGKIDTWDYIWQFAMLIVGGLCIVPSKNIILNSGFDSAATHTKLATFHSKLPLDTITFPLVHPKKLEVSADFENAMVRSYSYPFMLFDLIKSFFQR